MKSLHAECMQQVQQLLLGFYFILLHYSFSNVNTKSAAANRREEGKQPVHLLSIINLGCRRLL